MRPLAALTTLALLSIPLAGCMDVFGGDESTPEGKVHNIDLYICPSVSTKVDLYEMNDGGQMQSVALGFQADCDDDLVVPNPAIDFITEGDTVRLTVHNLNPLAHTFHLHGGLVDWEMDGVPFLNQMPIHSGEEYTYVYEDIKAGTYFYHCHVDVAHHMDLGMYGSFIVKERQPTIKADRDYTLMLDEWDNCHIHGNLDPIENSENNGHILARAECMERQFTDYTAQGSLTNPQRMAICQSDAPQEVKDFFECENHASPPPGAESRGWYPETFPVYDPEYNTYLINGKAFPDTAPIVGAEGETVRMRLINVGDEMHSMHLHGHYMLVTHRDGFELDNPFRVDTLGIMPGERYDVVVKMDNPGLWAFHDHVGLNVMNDHQAPGGMFTCFAYEGFSHMGSTPLDIIDSRGRLHPEWERSVECLDTAQEILGSHAHG